MLTDQEAAELGRAIGTLIEERGLGAISKKDYELLVFHHISSSVALRSDGNYLLANKLKVTETKIKTLRLEASIRHKPANHKAVLGNIVQRMIDEMHKPDFSGGVVSITLENPIDRREFEYAVKVAKHSVEYGINREILKIDALALFEIPCKRRACGGSIQKDCSRMHQDQSQTARGAQQVTDIPSEDQQARTGSHKQRGCSCSLVRSGGTTVMPNISVNRSARKLRLPVPSALRAQAAGYLKR